VEINMVTIVSAVLSAVITGTLTLAGVVITTKSTQQKMQADLEKAQAVTRTELKELTREVREHNNFAKRMPVVEEQIRIINQKIAELERRR